MIINYGFVLYINMKSSILCTFDRFEICSISRYSLSGFLSSINEFVISSARVNIIIEAICFLLLKQFLLQ